MAMIEDCDSGEQVGDHGSASAGVDCARSLAVLGLVLSHAVVAVCTH